MMTTFNMPDNRVSGHQYIASRDMQIGVVHSRLDVSGKLQNLKTEVMQAQRQGQLSEQLATKAQDQIEKAVQQAEQAQPNKQTLLEHINTAKSLLEGVQVVAGIVAGLAALAQAVQQLF